MAIIDGIMSYHWNSFVRCYSSQCISTFSLTSHRVPYSILNQGATWIRMSQNGNLNKIKATKNIPLAVSVCLIVLKSTWKSQTTGTYLWINQLLSCSCFIMYSQTPMYVYSAISSYVIDRMEALQRYRIPKIPVIYMSVFLQYSIILNEE